MPYTGGIEPEVATSTDMSRSDKAKLATKLVAAMKAIDAVAKTGYNQNQKYNYVQAADVADEVRSVLVELGIAFTFSVTDVKHWDRVPTDPTRATMTFFLIEADATFTDSESGESETIHCVGAGTDTLDKGIYKALTGALKYAMRMDFMIPDNADPENDSKDEKQEVRGTVRAPKQAWQQPSNHAQESTLIPDPSDYFSSPPNMDAEPPEKPSRPKFQQPAQSGPPIGPKAKVLYAIAMGKNWSTAAYREWVNRLGYAKDADIPMSRFNELKAQLEAL